jgi:phage gpG-like protein
MIRIDLTEAGLSLPKLNDLILGASKDALDEATALILNRIRSRFLSQDSAEGVAWEPSYAAFYRSMTGRGGGTLFDTGKLFHSIQLFSVSPTENAIGTDIPYAIFHQFGTVNLPVREFLAFNQEDEDLAYAVLSKKLKEIGL